MRTGSTERPAEDRQEENKETTRRIAQFSVSFLQVLDENGIPDERLMPELNDDELLEMYRAMVVAREADQRQLKLQRQGRMGTFGPCTGQEAAVVGPTYAMTKDDWFVGAFREIGGRLMRGVSLVEEYLYWNGYEEGNYTPNAGRTLPNAVIVGGQTLHAVGIAYAMKYRGEKSAVVTFLGDGATSQGDVHEAMNYASVWQVPVVFVCLNNQWAISTPRGKQTNSRTLAQKAIAYDMPGIQVDGNDVLATYLATHRALSHARAGGGPTFIEAKTYRLMMHTTADDPTKYRPREEEDVWWTRDPLPRFREFLERRELWGAEREESLLAEVRADIDASVKELESRGAPKPDTPFDHVFGTTHEMIEEQRALFFEHRKQEAEDA